MQQQLSPKKYIQVRARTLPIYKCFVNRNWRDAGMANVFVSRRHVTGNLTSGAFLVDLQCLGIKDTFFYFNEPEEDLMDRLAANMFIEIDYALAHNIIYAGHDFAMEFDIHPHKDFSLTSLILEKDNDAVPLIEVHTGDTTGKPHLMVESTGQYSEALAKLKKHVGEGGYHYTVGEHLWNDDDELDEPDDEELWIDEFEKGEILPVDAKYIRSEDLFDEEKVQSRDAGEQRTLHLELMLRSLRRLRPGLFDFEYGEDLPEFKRHLGVETAPTLNGPDPADKTWEEGVELLFNTRIGEDLLPLLEGEKDETYETKVRELAHAFKDNIRATARLFEVLLISKRFADEAYLIDSLQEFAGQHPYARLVLAFGALRFPDVVPGDYSDVYQSSDISEIFPEYRRFHAGELCLYWMIRLLLAAQAGDVPAALRFYSLIADTEVFSIHLMEVQTILIGLLDPILQEEMSQDVSAD